MAWPRGTRYNCRHPPSPSRLKRIDVIRNRDLAQQHLANDVRRLDVIRENCRDACAPRGKIFGNGCIIQSDPNNKRPGLNAFRRHRSPRNLVLPRRDCLQHRFNLTRVDLPRPKLESDFDWLSGQSAVAGVDKSHDGRQRQIGNPRALEQRDVGDIAIARRTHDSLV